MQKNTTKPKQKPRFQFLVDDECQFSSVCRVIQCMSSYPMCVELSSIGQVFLHVLSEPNI